MSASETMPVDSVERVCESVQSTFNVAFEQFEAAAAIIDAAAVLCALERAPCHQDTHPSHNIRTGGGYAHGRRLDPGTLPLMLSHARGLVQMAMNDVDCLREDAISALKQGCAE